MKLDFGASSKAAPTTPAAKRKSSPVKRKLSPVKRGASPAKRKAVKKSPATTTAASKKKVASDLVVASPAEAKKNSIAKTVDSGTQTRLSPI